ALVTAKVVFLITRPFLLEVNTCNKLTVGCQSGCRQPTIPLMNGRVVIHHVKRRLSNLLYKAEGELLVCTNKDKCK
ncbi:hypothetical protein, partial [Vibrio sp. Vb0888]|uniref:hypothetical protein n=1 Tax=Vibrio sp. Vb0888 TaxID=3074632 RepID=UPI0029654341